MTRSASLRLALVALTIMVLSIASSRPSRSSAAVDGTRGRLSLRVVDQRGQPLAARVRLASRSAGFRVSGTAERRLVVREEGADLELSPGRYLVRVSRGIEYGLAELTVDVPGGGEVRRTVMLEHQVALSGWQGADLHVHTAHSSDAQKHGGIAAHDLRAEGISLAAITDHNHVGALAEGIDAVPGAELTTWAPEVGHFNAFPLQELPTWRGTTPEKLLSELSRQPGVFVQVNHPRLQDHIAYFELGAFDGERFARKGFTLAMDGLEVWNGYDLTRPRMVKSLLEEWRHWLAQGHRLTATGGSDSHGSAHHLPGYPRTYVHAASGAAMAPALKRGQAFVTNGPLMQLKVEGKTAGDTVDLTGKRSVTVDLTVLAPDWLSVEQAEIWLGEERVVRERIPEQRPGTPLRFRLRRTLEVRGQKALHALVHGGSGLEKLLDRRVEPLAFTNPVYLKTAGK